MTRTSVRETILSLAVAIAETNDQKRVPVRSFDLDSLSHDLNEIYAVAGSTTKSQWVDSTRAHHDGASNQPAPAGNQADSVHTRC